MNLNNYLYEDGLYLNKDEFDFYSVQLPENVSVLTFEQYLGYYEEKLKKSLFKFYAETLQEEFHEDDIAFSLAQLVFGQPFLNQNEVFMSYLKKLEIELLDSWGISERKFHLLDLDNIEILVTQLLDVAQLRNLLYEFYERIDILQRGDNLFEYYEENEIEFDEGEIEQSEWLYLIKTGSIETTGFSEISNFIIEHND